ncbi:MAG: ABC transporter ATP-binding protein, partial [Myxococcota bacterium]
MVLAVEGLSVQFRTEEGAIDAVRQVSFDIAPGEILCLVGESGSGKSVTSLALMGLLPQPTGRVAAGRARFAPPGIEAVDLLSAGERVVRRLRGDRIAMVFQDPMTSLNPYLRVGAQLDEVLIAHQALSPAEAKRRSVTMLDEVGLNEPERRHRQYPHELSGGMRQRVMIAMAMILEPRLLIADEPTTALDVTVQAQILQLIKDLQAELGMALVMITHDLGVIAETV